MKKIVNRLFIAFAALCGLVSGAQNAKSLLWKITGNGLSAPSYLYGTIHVTCDATLEKPTLEALDNTAQLYLELDLDDQSNQMTMVQGMVMKDGKTMQSMVSDADYKLLDTYLRDKIKIGATTVNNMKPAMISTLLLPALMDCPMQSVEQELMKANASHNKETFGLEKVEDQIAVFDKIPYQDQMDDLMKSVKGNFTDQKKELDEMYALYKTKDVDAMQKMTDEDKTTADYEDILLNDRNADWIPKIETIAKTKPTFFAVGAAHLGGDKGVIALLRKKGFKVEAVLQ